jgi:4-methyl-5(b-hydroxyethyl)-thiazole monophosphate biosynthesis
MKKILLYLPNGFIPYEASVFTDVLGWNRLEGDGTTTVVTCGKQEKVQDAWGLSVIPEITIADIKSSEYDALAIPGGFEESGYYKDVFSSEFLSVVSEFDQGSKIIAAICVGALPLGKSGVLNGRKGTTYFLKNGYRQKELTSFGVTISDKPLVVDKNIITSSSPATALDVAFTLLCMLTSSDNCLKVKQLMGFSI